MGVKLDFKSLDQAVEAEWPVRCTRPVDGGSSVLETFTARFRMLSEKETADLQKQAVESDTTAWIRGFFVGLGQEHEERLDEELLGKLLSRPYIRAALIRAYFEFQAGRDVKNSETPPA